ncbi:nuclear receptor-interacting protein 3-like [Amphiura filiformis]|uniref:nuclear receptor-interacting protein 3-like n=1 Tax=Amphiura filiformis TaxID=82378 RepID=UPI003B214D2D
MAAAIARPDALKSPTRNVPTLTTKSSTDLLPLEMRLGTSKDAQPHAILRKKQMQKLDIPKDQVRRKSSTDIDEQKRCHHYQPEIDTTLLYVECQVNGETAVGLIDTGCLHTLFPKEAAGAYNLCPDVTRENGLRGTCPCTDTAGEVVNTVFRLGSIQQECPLHISSSDDSMAVLRIGMDILRKWRCVLDLNGCILYVGGATGEAVPLLSHENLFGDTRLVRSQSSTL